MASLRLQQIFEILLPVITAQQKIKVAFAIVPVAGRVIPDKSSRFTQVIFLSA